jgi:preprotein translocase subunit SecD
MTSVRDLLRDADPCACERHQLESNREAIRRAIALARPHVPGRPSVHPRMRLRRAAFVAAFVVVSVVALAFWRQTAPAVQASPVRFEMRLAEDQAAPGLREARIAGSDRVVYLHDGVIVDNDDVATARVVRGDEPSRFNVQIEFTAGGAEKMRRATEGQVGARIAILLDDEVVMAPTVRAEVDSIALLSGRYSQAEAKRLAAGIAVR